jgi:hypothetical protein
LSGEVTFEDVQLAVSVRSPALGELLVRYLQQSDPDAGRDELSAASDESQDSDEESPQIDVVAGAFTIDRLRGEVNPQQLTNKNPTERKLTRREAFAAAEASGFSPPRLRLGNLLIELYQQAGQTDAYLRGALFHVFANATLKWGVWKAAKTIYKRAEEAHDAAMFGVLAYRFDSIANYARNEIGVGTLVYLRRRSWRFLRLLGQASPDAYPTFAVEVLRQYPASHRNSSSWIAAHIFGHANLRGVRGMASFQPPTHGDPMVARAFAATWKISPAPLLRLLDEASNELVCDWAVRCLRADHALTLRAVDPAWLARLGQRPIAAINAFVVSLLRESPEFHQSKLKQLGMHDVVIGFLRSGSSEARTYALEYCNSQKAEISVEELADLCINGESAVITFALARLETMSPSVLGLDVLLSLLGHTGAPWVETRLAQGFSPKDVSAVQFCDAVVRGNNVYNALVKFWNTAGVTLPAGHFKQLIDDARFNTYQFRSLIKMVYEELAKRSATDIGVAWIQSSFEKRERTEIIARWLDAGMLSGATLDVDWLKSLVAKPRLRTYALKLLADRRRVTPATVGLRWLLDIARSGDAELESFSQRMLLESFLPEDFADGNRDKGVASLWMLASGKKQPDVVRAFAATYLKAHHPELGPRQAESRSLGIKPKLTHEDYDLEIVKPLLDDDRADVRRFAVIIAGEELVRWNQAPLLYELASSHRSEVRALGAQFLLGVLVQDPAVRRAPADWIDGVALFALAESSHKGAREVALTLIRKLYVQVGGAERLAWLMDSPEREVRLFAVRLFWDRHRPKPWPVDYVPRKQIGAPIGTARFEDLVALRQFARVVLFGLPPGRIGEHDAVIEGAPKPERALPASVAKRRLIEAMRDVALTDIDLARAIAPVLGEFVDSTAKGEWQASLQALTALRVVHSELDDGHGRAS